MFVLPSAAKPRPFSSAPKSIGAVRTAQCAFWSKATTPSWSVGASASAARRIASLAMSTFSKPRVPEGLALSRESPVQWQSAMLPDLSTTATIATSGERSRSRTVMYTGSVSSSGVSR